MTSAPPDPDRVAAAVLAGGAGSRMGRPKAGAMLAGRPLIDYPLEALRAAGLDPFIVTKADRPLDATAGGAGPAVAAEVVVEPDRPRHPLVGILAAIEHARGRSVLVVACDMPLLPPPLLGWLAERTGGTVVPRVSGHLQPLAALYGPEAAAPVRAGIERGLAIRKALAELDPVTIEEDELRRFGDPARMFANANTPEDLARIETELRSGR